MTILGDFVGANGGSPEEEALSKTQGLFRGQKSLFKETVEAEDYVARPRSSFLREDYPKCGTGFPVSDPPSAHLAFAIGSHGEPFNGQPVPLLFQPPTRYPQPRKAPDPETNSG